MKKICYLLLLICVPILLCTLFSSCKPPSQQEESPEDGRPDFAWVQKAGGIGHDQGYAVAADGSGSLYITGFFERGCTFAGISLSAFGGEAYDIFLAKYDNSGALVWVKQAGSTDYDEGAAIAVDSSGNIYMTGYFKGTAAFGNRTLISSGDRDIFTARYNSSGDLVWVKQAGGSGEDNSSSVTADSMGNIVVTGSFSGTASFGNTTLVSKGGSDIFTAKYAENGNLLWVKQAGGSSFDHGHCATAGSGDNIYITGSFKDTATFGNKTITSNGDRDFFVARYNQNGNVSWVEQGGGDYWDYGYAVDTGNSGDVYVTGSFFDAALFEGTSLIAEAQNDIFIAKYDSSGNLVWIRQAGGSSYDRGKAIAADNRGGIYVAGHFKKDVTFENVSLTAYGLYDMFVAKYNSSGDFLWAKRAGGDDYDEACSITVDNNDNIYITGSYSCYQAPARFDDISLNSNGFDIFIAKIAGTL